ncbi:predicted protein [Uncinocarpus reesii 1704]|uniref:DHHA2 domain-containing protein n=1 Tax=Uncinocarpus reesii (strain UAMH 1704) TaxID=336963 RepID=C4JM28_UNCRE|nr:uncharacterized protein UREG_03886 [Uncinocarpus reesii 1704]EEP79040.1 predicted protein [Uncinocarpus reesii 1704]
MATKSRASTGLVQYLRQAAYYSSQQARHQPVTYVLGNPSADLDSIISAIIYSYIATSTRQGCLPPRHYVPIINLPDVRSGNELGRLRPEFITALKLATKDSGNQEADDAAFLKQSILTVADLKEQIRQTNSQPDSAKPIEVFMVDWNALPVLSSGRRGIEGFDDDTHGDIPIAVTGCIDHHYDEKFVPPDVTTWCIQTGVGSCTSLVVRELRSRGLWRDTPFVEAVHEGHPQLESSIISSLRAESEVAKLALAAILADTTNMTAKDKVSEVDRLAVSFLKSKINQAQDPSWNCDKFYEEIINAKNSSVDKLTTDEVLGRDYKDWIDDIPATRGIVKKIKIGICSVVKPISWLISKASQEHQSPESPQQFFDSLRAFAQSRNLDVVAVMTAYTTQPENQFHRELLVWCLDKGHSQGFELFEALAIDKLGLQNLSGSNIQTFSNTNDDMIRIWRQTDVSKSRKQVAPLLRNAMTESLL